MNKINKTDKEWKELLDSQTYSVTRKSATEPPFTGKYLNVKSKGVYCCICCGNELFSSESKFNSNSGWPSFFEAINDKNVTEIIDNSHNMIRTEVVCTSCDSHLGHVFNDGPNPSGLRYCINSVSLKLKKID
tara:strand:+ start:553 stop:948 length:396 start_codon:yes stop_codon:yes gene_type:complete